MPCEFTCLVNPLQGGLHGFQCAWRLITPFTGMPYALKTSHSTPSNRRF